jgi:dynein heavy chain
MKKTSTFDDSNMFALDYKKDFSLPRKSTLSTILPKVNRKEKTKKTKTAAVSEEAADTVTPSSELRAENAFSFLSGALGKQVSDVDEGMSGRIKGKPPQSPTKNNDTSDVDEVSVIMNKILTSDDAINYFARFGSETPVKFVHLIENSDKKVYQPYNLTVTKLSDPTIEHYTMSPAGIVYMVPGEPSECIPLSAFMRQGMIFKILRAIPYYKHFLVRKTLTIWRENVRFLLFSKQRKKLTERLFYARNNSCEAILSVKKHLIEVKNVRLLNLDLKTCDKDIFIELQTAQGAKANAQFDEAMRSVISEVQNVIVAVNNMYNMSKVDPSSSMMNYTDGTEEKAKSLVQLKQEKIDRRLLRQRAKLEHGTLPEFIRFVDYMAIETLVTLAVNTCSIFYDELVKPRKAGLFETMVRFSASGRTTFSPPCEDIREMLDRLLENIINSVGNVNRVSYLNSKVVSAQGPNI